MKPLLRISISMLLGVAALLLTACSQPDGKLPYPINIEETKAGRITQQTPFEASHIATLMPGFDIKPYTSFIAGIPHTVLYVMRNEQPIMSIIPTADGKKVQSVTVHSPEVTAQHRIRVGSPFEKIFRCADPCSRDDAYGKNKLLCKAPGSLHIYYLFSVEGDMETPDELKILHTSPLEAIIWKSDA